MGALELMEGRCVDAILKQRLLRRGTHSDVDAQTSRAYSRKNVSNSPQILSKAIDKAVKELKGALPEDVRIENHIFRQADFIEAAIENVEEAIRDGVIWVIIILFLFLWNFRTSAIAITAIPLSIIITSLIFDAFGLTINTMTLGGIAVAVGELVDDSLVDMENIFRRLKENRTHQK